MKNGFPSNSAVFACINVRVQACGLAALISLMLLPMAFGVGDFESAPDGNGGIVITAYVGSATTVEIPATLDGLPVVRIGSEAFQEQYSLTSVTIPEGVTSIGNHAFYSCVSLESVTLPSTLNSIGDWAFSGCDFAELVLPEGLAAIGDRAFSGCREITAITIPDGISTISDGLFSSCEHLDQINLPASISSIGSEAFKNCFSLADISIPAGVTEIGASAFQDCRDLVEITIPANVSEIGEFAFLRCALLERIEVELASAFFRSVDGVLFNADETELVGWPFAKGRNYIVPAGVTRIGDNVFSGTPLTGVTLPESLTEIGVGAFENCSSLAAVNLPASVEVIGDSAFAGCRIIGNLALPGSLLTIGTTAFANCHYLSEFNIPIGVTSIGSGAFSNCTRLIEITVAPGNPSYSAIDGVLYDSGQGSLIRFPQAKSGDFAISSSVSAIAPGAFSGCAALTSLSLSASVVMIGEGAFAGCGNVTALNVPAGVARLEARTFAGCQNLPDITIPSGVTYVGDGAFAECARLTAIELPEGLEYLGEEAFERCSRLESISIPPGITSLGDWTFESCLALSSVSLPAGLTSIGSYAFRNCEGLVSITIPDGVADIGVYAFGGCSGLRDVVLPASLSVVERGLFSDCPLLGLVTVPESVTSIEPLAFRNCARLDIRLPSGLTTIGESAFYGCGMSEIVFPARVTTIGDSAFGQTLNLAGYFFLGDAPELGEDSFDGIDGDIGMVYRRPGTSGWDDTYFGGFRVALWESGFIYSSSGAEITITGWSHSFNAHRIPETIDGLPVTGIGGSTFDEEVYITQLVIPASVVNIDRFAFYESPLQGLYFEGDAPELDPGVTSIFNFATVYHLADAGGWGAEWGGRPTALWVPGQGAVTSIVLEPTTIELSWNAFQLGEGYSVEQSGDGVSWRIVGGFENVYEHAASIPRGGVERRFLRVRAR